jgi:hypothetical protein
MKTSVLIGAALAAWVGFAAPAFAGPAQKMADIKVRRLPVLNHDKRLVGIVSIGDLALADGPSNVGEALCDISKPGGAHSQSADGSIPAR